MTRPRRFLARLRQLGWLATSLAAMATANSANAGNVACDTGFSAPRQPMALTRTLRRELGDGREVITRRSYRIHFSPNGAGFRVDGELTGVEVTVPPQLEAIAQLERNRPDDGLFPILLNAQGTITMQDMPIGSGPPVAAQGTAGTMIASSALPPTDKAMVLRFVDGLLNMRGGVLTKWPADLFRPATAQSSATTRVPLAGGQSGTVTVALATTSERECGLLRSFERVVTTDAGGQKRVTHERWVLASLAP